MNASAAASGGAATYTVNLAQSLQKRGLSRRFTFAVPAALAGAVHDAAADTAVVMAPSDGGALRRFVWEQRALRRVLRDRSVDILFSAGNLAMFRCPCVQVLLVRNHMYFSALYRAHSLPRRSRAARFAYRVRRALIVRSIRTADVVLTPSEAMRMDVAKGAGVDPVRIASNHFGVPLGMFSQGSPAPRTHPDRIAVVYVVDLGRDGEYKNVETLLAASIGLTRQRGRVLDVAITADASEVASVLSAGTRRGLAVLEGGLRLTGRCSYSRVARLYADSDVMVFPSLTESFGHPLVEAMASGCAIIAADLPVHREICGDAALYFPPLDGGALMERLAELIDEPVRRAQLGERGLRRAREWFDWEGHVERLLMCFEAADRRRP